MLACFHVNGHAMLRFEVLAGLPGYGPMPLPFAAGAYRGAWSGHSEGFIVRFHPKSRETWVGNFQPETGGWRGILRHPNGNHLVVVASGFGYIVDPETCQLVSMLDGCIQHALALPDLDAIIFSDGLRFEAITSGGVWWQSSRISWDEIRNIKIEGAILHGEASSVPAPSDGDWVPFTLDLTTGQCEGGVFEQKMRRAVRVTRTRNSLD